MGKRRERRHAAQSAAGRRVKLDLFAEPSSGDFGASSAKDEVGGEGESENRAELSKAPLSSGEGPANPLLLLGQYSDDELDEENSDGVNDAIVENASSNFDDQVHDSGREENEETNRSRDVTEQKVEQDNLESLPASVDTLLEERYIRGDDDAGSGDLLRETNMTGQISAPGMSDTHTIEDVSSGWKMVLHEESNSYYYWNIVTGETSWVAPDNLLQGTEAALAEERKVVLLDTQNATSIVNVGISDAAGSHLNGPSYREGNEVNGSITEENVHNEMNVTNVLGQEGNSNNCSAIDEVKIVPVDANHSNSLTEDFVSLKQLDDTLLERVNKESAGSAIQNMVDLEHQQSTSDLSNKLVRHGEYLLGRLKSLKGTRDYEIEKLMLAVEIRLHDMRSLRSYGSSLLPFWLHSESQLKELEAAIDDEVLKFCESAKIGENNAAHTSDEIICHDANTNAKKAVSSTPEGSDACTHVDSSWDFQEHLSKDGDGRDMAIECGTGKSAEPNTEVQTEDDDMDMDVEMEVEEPLTAADTVDETAQHTALLNQPMPQAPSEHDSPLEEGQIPPPPDDEWIPPPPPEEEPIPPPPPDEPTESAPLPPSEFQAVHQFSYTDHYNLAYHGSGLEYYGQTSTEIPSSGYYVDSNGCQVVAPLPQIYYTPVLNTYSTAASGLVNPVEPITYYTFQDGSSSTAPMISGVEPPGLQSTSDHVGHISVPSGVEAQNEVGGFTPVSTAIVHTSSVGNESEGTTLEAHLVSAPVQASATNSTTYAVPVISKPEATATVPSKETVSKVQSKATRPKKRTVSAVSSLRSNKKVSGLVDKWKAAKEEMQEDEEEEPEDPYERLEKKRQREIEEWRAQQIASGEAKDNANFQPLGGDWRERVMRKRAKKMSEASPQAPPDEGSQQSDLKEASKGLPPGWQAYWDESSKQFYYGNPVTSETTWIRPTN